MESLTVQSEIKLFQEKKMRENCEKFTIFIKKNCVFLCVFSTCITASKENVVI